MSEKKIIKYLYSCYVQVTIQNMAHTNVLIKSTKSESLKHHLGNPLLMMLLY